MKHLKRLVSILLVTVMVFSLVPAVAFASLLDNSAEYNEEILRALEEVVGSENEAKAYYKVMEQYGLLDEEGDFVDDLSATIDGKEYNKSELLELLSGDYDSSKFAVIDGTKISLDNLWNIIFIEGYIDYLRDKYFIDGEWTKENEETYNDFLAQVTTLGANLVLDQNSTLSGEYSGVNHGAVVSFSATRPTKNVSTVTVKLSAANKGQVVSFDYEVLSGSSKVQTSKGSISMTADSNGNATKTFNVTCIAEDYRNFAAIAPVWYLNVSNLKNALFAENSKNAATITLNGEHTIGNDKDVTGFVSSATCTKEVYQKGYMTFNRSGKFAVEQGWLTKLSDDTLSQDCFRAIREWEPIKTGPFHGNTTFWFDYTIRLNGSNGKAILSNYVSFTAESLMRTSTGKYTCQPTIKSKWEFKRTKQLSTTIQPLTESDRLYMQTSSNTDGLEIRITLSDVINPTVKSITTPKADYTVGQSVPIIVEYSEPVRRSSAYIIVNGTKIYAKETGDATRLSFLYPVKDVDSAHPVVSSVYCQDIAGHAIDSTYKPNPNSNAGLALNDATLKSCLPEGSIGTVSYSINQTNPAKPVLVAEFITSTETARNAWMAGDIDANGKSKSLSIAIRGFDKENFKIVGTQFDGAKMTASIELLPVDVEKQFTVEMYKGSDLMVGSLKYVTQKPATYVKSGDITISTLVRASNGAAYQYEDSSNPVIKLAENDMPLINAVFSLENKDYVYANKKLVTVLGEDGKPLDASAHFAWKSENPEIANIDANGTIIPTGKSGSVSFTLIAFNGSEEKKVSATSKPIKIDGTGLHSLKLSSKNIKAVAGNKVPLYWSCKLENVEYTVQVSNKGGVIHTATTSALNYVIPKDILTFDYNPGADNTYEVKVSCIASGDTYEGEAVIELDSAPAVVRLDSLATYYYQDVKHTTETDLPTEIDLGWTINNYDIYSSKDDENLFELQILKNNNVIYTTNNPGIVNNGVCNNSYKLSFSDVITKADDPLSYRDIYTVTIKAKSGTDSSWSYDSCIIYVYDRSALKIWVKGVEKDSVSLSNIPQISSMSQDQILALQRDINLKTIVSANYGDFAWTDLSDRLTWSSENTAIANLYYSQGGSYASIDDYDYTNYRPATEFMLSGLDNGSTKITVTHDYAKITDSLDVEISTLKDKLYIFACEPMTSTTLHYVNGNGDEKSVTSNANGEFAVYDESGIASDVYFESSYEGCQYYGTIRNALLQSGEQDPGSLNLYPQNNIVLRRAAYATVYLKNPNGTPFTGNIAIRSGVYVDGEYIAAAKFGYGADAVKADKAGDEDVTALIGSDGKLSVLMDITQWGLENDELTQDNIVEYNFLVTKADSTQYYPLLIKIDASENEENYVRSGDNVATFRNNEVSGKHPFVIDANVTLANDLYGYRETVNILDDTGSIGISPEIPEEDLAVSVMWWGIDGADSDAYSMSYYVDKTTKLSDSEELITAEYPFISSSITTLYAEVNHDIASKAGIGVSKKNIELRYSNLTRKVNCSEDLSFSIADTTDMPITSDAAEHMRESISNAFNGTTSSNVGTLNMSDNLVSLVMQHFITEDYKPDKDHAAGFSMQVIPTKDPLTFIAYLGIGLSNMSDKNVTGVYASGAEEKLHWAPKMKEVKLLFGSGFTNYTNAYKKDFDNAVNSKTTMKPDYNITGYLESRLTLNPDSDLWEIHVMSGGFDAGGGVSFVKYINTWLGPVPITAELRGGGNVNVSLDTLTLEYLTSSNETINGAEFLTKLRIYFYFKFFGGIGWDFSIAALKIGLYGQINADLTFEWLNRPDIPNFAMYSDGLMIQNTSKVLSGQSIKLGGQVGIEFVAKLLFFSYEKAIFSYNFPSTFEKTWGSWTTIDSLWQKSQDYYNTALHNTLSLPPSLKPQEGEVLMLDMAPTTLQSDEEGSWNENTFLKPGLFGAVRNDETKVMLSKANPYAAPALSDDGNVLLYLTSSNGVVRTAYAVKGSNGFVNGGVISNLGFNSTGNVIAGNKDKAFAAWSSMGVDHNLESGTVVSPEEQIIMMDSSEVYASVYDGSKWTTTQLTSNDTADVSPAIAANDNSAIVAWRSVATSNLDGNIADFNENDTILFKIYKNGSFSNETYTLYNGTSGNVKALNAAMLSDGTAAVIFVIDTDSDDSTYLDREVFWAVVGKDNNEKPEVKRVVRATNDVKTDENPQIAATKIGGNDCFVAAWYSSDETATTQHTYYDICMADFGPDGIVMDRIPQSLEKMIKDKDLHITSDFRFTKGSNGLDDIALVWVERNEESDVEKGYTVEYDVLNSLKFYTYSEGKRIALTGVQELVEAPASTLINNFDVVCTNNEAMTVFLGTEYSQDEVQEKKGQMLDGTVVTYNVPKSVSNIYSAKGEYIDQLSVLSIDYDEKSIKKGASTPILFTVLNDGINQITEIAVKLDGKEIAKKEHINLNPGESITVTGTYSTDKIRITETPYIITAKTDQGDVFLKGGITLVEPAIVIVKSSVVGEDRGVRTIQVNLNNDSKAKLEGSGKTVQLSFYSDPTYTQPIRKGISTVNISDDDTLRLIDEGAFSGQVQFNPAQFLERQSFNTGTIDAIPEDGIPVYMKVDIVNSDGTSMNSNAVSDTASVMCENLQTRTGKSVSISSKLTAANFGSLVTAGVRNNTLQKMTQGAIQATLYNEAGEAVETQTIELGNNNAIAGEETKQLTFSFARQGNYAEVEYVSTIEEPEPYDPYYPEYDDPVGPVKPDEPKDYEMSFVDLNEKAYYYDAVLWAVKNGITAGIDTTHFVPNGIANRAQMVTFLWRAAGCPKPTSTKCAFTDIVEGSYYYDAVLWAVEKGITSGTSETTFAPTDTVNRSQAVTFMARMCGVKDKDAGYTHPFADVKDGAYYNNAVAWAYENKITDGTSETTFSPTNDCLRGQIVTYLYRHFGN